MQFDGVCRQTLEQQVALPSPTPHKSRGEREKKQIYSPAPLLL
jgi:hypothetical protein